MQCLRGLNKLRSFLDAVSYKDRAWRDVTQSTISNCFRKAGYAFETPTQITEEYVSELTDQDKDLCLNIKDFLHLWKEL